jgi:hypothetical protein
MTQLYEQLLLLKDKFRVGLRINCLFLASRSCSPPEMLGFRTKTLHALNSLKNGIGLIHTTSLRRGSMLHKAGHMASDCDEAFMTMR